MKTLLHAVVVASLASFAAPVAVAEAPDKYQTSCFACHSTGAAGAPRTGDAEAWAPRLAKGMDELVESVRKGFGAMPPTGLCADCSDEQYRAMIEYMAAPAE